MAATHSLLLTRNDFFCSKKSFQWFEMRNMHERTFECMKLPYNIFGKVMARFEYDFLLSAKFPLQKPIVKNLFGLGCHKNKFPYQMFQMAKFKWFSCYG